MTDLVCQFINVSSRAAMTFTWLIACSPFYRELVSFGKCRIVHPDRHRRGDDDHGILGMSRSCEWSPMSLGAGEYAAGLCTLAPTSIFTGEPQNAKWPFSGLMGDLLYVVWLGSRSPNRDLASERAARMWMWLYRLAPSCCTHNLPHPPAF